ncbi:hypothetical protein BGZ61DRAFT_547339 [Ilyonectria robusta]|uniref:uncharacterized protein n=1 Tax=Ilyonectria robusta TaxID=1079257 RepID=UPI001E8EE9B1|nr:uncharacterized protein BGZ61DRAFT_547339 [Ilyonectria robusta]KAH8686811.1 hypothetical protein BGZ61DRAFT_547339 [Ilyonectria robusta]
MSLETTMPLTTESTDITPTEPAHKGILRDDTVVLRWIFGFCGEAQLGSVPVPWPRVPLAASPPDANSHMRRMRFISIDIDKLEEQDGVIKRFHIGVSVLNTQSLQNLLLCRPEQEINLASRVIESHHWVVEDAYYYHERDNLFLFGKPKLVTLSRLEARLKQHLQVPNFTLVFHGGRRELSVLQRLNINLNPLYTIDTVNAAQHPLQLSYRYSLKQLLQEFEIPQALLHTAGNDAHFILRALLMITVRDVERQLSGKQLPDWVPILKEVARSPLPPQPPTWGQKIALNRKKRKLKKLEQERREDLDGPAISQTPNDTLPPTCIQD